MLLIKGWRKQAVANRDRLVETMQQQQANNQEQEQEHNFGLEPQIAWEITQDSYLGSVALLRLAFLRKRIVNEESLPRLALWLVRSRARRSIKDYWYDWGYVTEKQARAAWKRDNVLREQVDYTHFERKLRQFLFEPTPSWRSR